MSKNYTLDDILNEYSGKEKPKSAADNTNKKPAAGKPKVSSVEENLQNTGYIKIPRGDADNTIAYNVDELVRVNAPEKRPSPSHRSGKFQVSDVSRPNVSYINSVKEVVKNPADLPPRPADQIKDYDGAVLTKNYSNEEYAPKVRKMSDSTRAKEMRSKRKKKKQPVFTYDRESPDGVYTNKPQKKNKKFVVSHEDGKKKKPDKMAPVSLSADTDPELLDIAVEPAHEPPRTAEESPKKSKSEAIRDYDSYEDPKEIKRSITDLKSRLSFRFTMLTILFLVSAFISVGSLLGLPVPKMLTIENPTIYTGTLLAVAALAMIFSIDTVKNGLFSLLKFTADTDSIAAFSIVASVAAAAVCMTSPEQVKSEKIHIYVPIAVLTLLINSLGKKLILKRAEQNFEFTVKEKEKYAVFCVEDEIRSESFTRGTIGDFPILASMKRTSFLKDFSRYTFSADSADKLCRPLVPIIIILSAAAAVGITFVKLKTFDKTAVAFALSIFTLYLSACSCMATPLIANIPLNRAAKKYSKKQGVLLGYQSVDDYYDVNSVMIDADRLFPTGTISLVSIKLFSDTKIDEALLYAASLTDHSGSVLRELFGDIMSGKVMFLKKVENFVCEDGMGVGGWVDNKRILMGNRELMQSHNIEGVPTKTKETEFTEGGRDALYLSVSGNLAAMFIIEITPSPAVKRAMKRLEKEDMAVVIKTIDHFVTINRISGIYDFTEDLLKIIPSGMIKDYHEETKKVRKTSTSLACSGKFHSFVNLLMSAKSIKKSVSSGIVFQAVSAILGMSIVSLNYFLSSFANLSPAWMLAYNLISTIVTVIVVGMGKV